MESYDLGTPVDPRLKSGLPRPVFAPQSPLGLQDPRRHPLPAPAQRFPGPMTSPYQGHAHAPFYGPPPPHLHFRGMPPPVAMGAVPPPNFNRQFQSPNFNHGPTFPAPPISPQPHPHWRPHLLPVPPPPPYLSFPPRFQPPSPQQFPVTHPMYVDHSQRSVAYFNPMGSPPPYQNHGGMSSGGMTPDTQPDQFVRKWLEEVSTHKQTNESSSMHMKIPEVRSRLMKGVELLSQLRSTHRALNALSLEDTTQWSQLKSRAELDKVAFLSVRASLDKPHGMKEHLTEKMGRVKSLRERRKRGYQAKREEHLASLERAERVTEEWIRNKEKKALKAKMEKAVQASASGVLEEVKRKKTDIKQLLSLSEALKELRSLRREHSRKKGDAPPIEADEKFQETQEALVDMLTQQSEVYQREEHALRVLMEEEVMEKMHSHQKEVFSQGMPQPPLPSTSDPWESYTSFYLCARSNKEALASIRTEWEYWISPEGSAPPPPAADFAAPPPNNSAWTERTISPAPHN